MVREFSVIGGSVTVSTTLIFLNPKAAPNFNIELLRWWIGQSANATSAQQRVQVYSEVSTFGTYVAATPTPMKRADPNASILVGSTTGASGTAGITATAEGAGAKTVLWDDAFNVLNGWLQVPTPPETLIFPAGGPGAVGLAMGAIPTTQTGWSFGCVYREV